MARWGNLRKHTTQKARDPSFGSFSPGTQKVLQRDFQRFQSQATPVEPHDLEALGTFFGTNLPIAKKQQQRFSPTSILTPKTNGTSFLLYYSFIFWLHSWR